MLPVRVSPVTAGLEWARGVALTVSELSYLVMPHPSFQESFPLSDIPIQGAQQQ